MGEQQLRWVLTGCTSRQRHYRVCTSKTLLHPQQLWCPFCMYSEQLWQDARLRVLPACELAFMQLLRAHGIDTNFSCQVQPTFWDAPFDFYHMQHGYFVQVDGRSHWVGMHQLSSSAVLLRDMQQNWAALREGVCVVRVHGDDVSKPECVLAAMAAAASGCSIVLTPSYMSAWVCVHGCVLPYVQAVLLRGGSCWCESDMQGNTIIRVM